MTDLTSLAIAEQMIAHYNAQDADAYVSLMTDDACKARGMHKGHTTEDGLWTLNEVECMGNCASAPMVQINDDNYEDLTAERLDAVLDALAAGKTPKAGTQEPGRHTVEPLCGPTSLAAMVSANHDYRGEWK